MRENLVRFVVCTSTLAQGVNLPIRYLIVTSVYQGKERIKVRDFYNLIGRAGRAGMHTEGSILFADPIVYDKRKSPVDGWRWNLVKQLLDPKNAEDCVSSLFQLIPLMIRNDRNKSKDKKDHSLEWDILIFTKAYIEGWDALNRIIDQIEKRYGNAGFAADIVRQQFIFFVITLSAIESFLLSHWDETEEGLVEADVVHLAEKTLAFFLADDQKKEHIRELFRILAENIATNITDPTRRKIYGRTLYGIQDAKAIEEWVQSNVANLLSTVDEEETLDLIWPLLAAHINSGVFRKFDKPEVRKEIALGWISGKPFSGLLEIIRKYKAKMIWGARRRGFKIDHVVDVCEGALAYDGALLVGALCEFIEMFSDERSDDLINRLQILQKRLKYGLPTESTIAIYELGFSDRVISQDIAASMDLTAEKKQDLIKGLKQNRNGAMSVIRKYPKLFQKRMDELTV